MFIAKGDKQYIFDVDGNKYLDLINALGSVSIGYNISKINKKISNGLKNGITFSLKLDTNIGMRLKIKRISFF